MRIRTDVDQIHLVKYSCDAGFATFKVLPLSKPEYTAMLEESMTTKIEFEAETHKKKKVRELDQALFDEKMFARVCKGWESDFEDQNGKTLPDTPEVRKLIRENYPSIVLFCTNAALNIHLHTMQEEKEKQEAEIKN